MALARALAAIVGEGGQACQSGELLAAQGAEFGQPQQQRQCGPLAEAWDADQELASRGEIIVPAQGVGEALQGEGALGFEAGDLAVDEALFGGSCRRFAAGLPAGDVLLDLLDQGQSTGEGCDPRVGSGAQ